MTLRLRRTYGGFMALGLWLLACSHNSGPAGFGTGGASESGGATGDVGGRTRATESGFGGAVVFAGSTAGNGGSAGRSIVDSHPFGEGALSSSTASATSCGNFGSGKPISIVAAQNAVAVSAGNLLAISPTDLSVLGTYVGSMGTHRLLVMASNGSRVAAVADESPKVVSVWDTKTRALVGTLDGSASTISALAIDSTGATVAAGSNDGSIKVWSASGGAATRTLTPSRYAIKQIAIESNNIAAIAFISLYLFGPSSDTPLLTKETAAATVDFAAGATALFVGVDGSQAVDVYDVTTGNRVTGGYIRSTTPDGYSVAGDVQKVIPTGSRSAIVVMGLANNWATDSVTFPIPDYRTPSARKVSVSLTAFAYRSGGSVGIDTNGNLRTIAADGTAGPGAALPAFDGNRLEIAPDGMTVAQGSTKGPVRLIAAKELTLQSNLTGNTSEITAVRYDHTGGRLFASSLDGTIRVWDTQKKTEIKNRQLGAVYSLALSPDDSKLAVGTVGAEKSNAGQVMILDSTTLVTQTTFDMATSNSSIEAKQANTVAFSPDGSALAIGGSYNALVQLWSLASGTPLWSREQQSYACAAVDVQFVSGNYLLASLVIGQVGPIDITPAGNTFRLYDIASGEQVSGYTLTENGKASQRNRFVIADKLLVGAYESGQIDVWHLPTGRLWFSIPTAHLQGVRDLAIRKDGSLLSSSPDGFINCWLLPKP